MLTAVKNMRIVLRGRPLQKRAISVPAPVKMSGSLVVEKGEIELCPKIDRYGLR